MANLNKVMLIGRLTRDPEDRAFSNGGMVAKFGFAVNNRKRNAQSGQWEDEPVFLECEAFNRGDQGTLATRVKDTLRKGQQIFVEGHLRLDQWEKDGQKRSQIKIVVDNFQYLEPKGGSGGGGDGGEGGSYGGRSSGGGNPRANSGAGNTRRPTPEDFSHDEPGMEFPSGGGGRPADEDIPF